MSQPEVMFLTNKLFLSVSRHWSDLLRVAALLNLDFLLAPSKPSSDSNKEQTG